MSVCVCVCISVCMYVFVSMYVCDKWTTTHIHTQAHRVTIINTMQTSIVMLERWPVITTSVSKVKIHVEMSRQS